MRLCPHSLRLSEDTSPTPVADAVAEIDTPPTQPDCAPSPIPILRPSRYAERVFAYTYHLRALSSTLAFSRYQPRREKRAPNRVRDDLGSRPSTYAPAPLRTTVATTDILPTAAVITSKPSVRGRGDPYEDSPTTPTALDPAVAEIATPPTYRVSAPLQCRSHRVRSAGTTSLTTGFSATCGACTGMAPCRESS